MAKSVLTSWRGLPAQHRYEDFALIAEVLSAFRPTVAIELGTAEGGFTAFLTDTVAAWHGRVVTFDRTVPSRLDQIQSDRCTFVEADLLAGPIPAVTDLIALHPIMFLYCDNGNKVTEIETYAPRLRVGSLLGCHDYEDEVPSAWVEPFLDGLGFRPYRHADFAALAHPDNYPRSLSRFWYRIKE